QHIPDQLDGSRPLCDIRLLGPIRDFAPRGSHDHVSGVPLHRGPVLNHPTSLLYWSSSGFHFGTVFHGTWSRNKRIFLDLSGGIPVLCGPESRQGAARGRKYHREHLRWYPVPSWLVHVL